jgi:hypothetical protein
MDTRNFETKQGAATTADLPRQEPHEGAADLKSSIASSDEERLAVGISTIGLQTKRLSGVQRKKAYQRKKDEGRDLDVNFQEKLLHLRISVRRRAVGV